LEGVHHRWLLDSCKNPEKSIPRTIRDGIIGPKIDVDRLAEFLVKEEAKLQEIVA